MKNKYSTPIINDSLLIAIYAIYAIYDKKNVERRSRGCYYLSIVAYD
jgi:hypothetical protein